MVKVIAIQSNMYFSFHMASQGISQNYVFDADVLTSNLETMFRRWLDYENFNIYVGKMKSSRPSLQLKWNMGQAAIG